MIDNLSLKDFFKNKNVLVTGGTGLIGRQLVTKLCDLNSNVLSVSLDDLELDNRSSYIKADLTSIDTCKKLTKDMDIVFHVAGIKGSIEVTKSKPASFMVPMLLFNTSILEASRINGVKDLVFTSSIGAYSSAEIFTEKDEEEVDPPMDFYPGWAKRIAELQIKAYEEEYGLNWSIVRPSNVYGPGDNFDEENAMVIPSLISKIHKKKLPVKVWGDGSSVRDFIYSGDVADGILLCAYFKTKSKYLNIGSGSGITIKDLIKTLKNIKDFDYDFDTTKSNGFPKRVMSIERAKKEIKFSPKVSIQDGLISTFEWFNKNSSEFLRRKNYFKKIND